MAFTGKIIGKLALVVDDQKSVRQVLSRILKNSKLEVVEAASGMEAVLAISNHAFDIIFMDLNMPEISGEDSMKTIIDMHPNAKIIVYSAFEDPSAKERLEQLGVAAILEKPASSFDIIETVKRVIGGAEKT